jgi:hypothetical protein
VGVVGGTVCGKTSGIKRSAATSESRKKVRQASFSLLGLAVVRMAVGLTVGGSGSRGAALVAENSESIDVYESSEIVNESSSDSGSGGSSSKAGTWPKMEGSVILAVCPHVHNTIVTTYYSSQYSIGD